MITFSQLCDNNKWGRLGNNMFQIAATIGHSIKCRTPWWIPKWKWSEYFGGDFYEGEWKATVYHNEPAFHYNEIKCVGDLDLRGYYQSKKYWEHCEDEIKLLFTPTVAIASYVNERINKNAVGIHIRRGDYVGPMAHYYTNLWEEGYYERALEKMEGPRFVISDDIRWCKDNFPKADYYGDGNAVEDMFLFASCGKKIIANSSLSWWGAYLGGGEVIAPKEWFKPVAKHNTQDLYLDSWQII